MTGTLILNENNDEYVIVYDFSKVEYSEKAITFENILSGTVVVCGRVLDASKVAEYDYCDTTSILRIRLKTEKLPRLKRDVKFSMNLLLDDSACSSVQSTVVKISWQNSSFDANCQSVTDVFYSWSVSGDTLLSLEFQNNNLLTTGTLQFLPNELYTGQQFICQQNTQLCPSVTTCQSTFTGTVQLANAFGYQTIQLNQLYSYSLSTSKWSCVPSADTAFIGVDWNKSSVDVNCQLGAVVFYSWSVSGKSLSLEFQNNKLFTTGTLLFFPNELSNGQKFICQENTQLCPSLTTCQSTFTGTVQIFAFSGYQTIQLNKLYIYTDGTWKSD